MNSVFHRQKAESPEFMSDRLLKTRLAISARFPEEAARANAYLVENSFNQDAHFVWIEKFSDMTTMAMAERDEVLVRAHLSLMSDQL